MKSDETDYDQPPTDTEKVKLALWEEGEYHVTLEYYIRRLYKNDDSGCKEKLQFHGNCWFWGVDIS